MTVCASQEYVWSGMPGQECNFNYTLRTKCRVYMFSGCFFLDTFEIFQCLDLSNYWMDFHETLHRDRANHCAVRVYLKILKFCVCARKRAQKTQNRP